MTKTISSFFFHFHVEFCFVKVCLFFFEKNNKDGDVSIENLVIGDRKDLFGH